MRERLPPRWLPYLRRDEREEGLISMTHFAPGGYLPSELEVGFQPNQSWQTDHLEHVSQDLGHPTTVSCTRPVRSSEPMSQISGVDSVLVHLNGFAP